MLKRVVKRFLPNRRLVSATVVRLIIAAMLYRLVPYMPMEWQADTLLCAKFATILAAYQLIGHAEGVFQDHIIAAQDRLLAAWRQVKREWRKPPSCNDVTVRNALVDHQIALIDH